MYDCVDLVLTSEWDDDDYTNFQSSKINIHPHFFQFDTGNSDGVISGFEYEMSVRPFTMLGKPRQARVAGADGRQDREAGPRPAPRTIKIQLAPGATPFHVNTEFMVGMDCLEKGNDPDGSLPRDKSCSGSRPHQGHQGRSGHVLQAVEAQPSGKRSRVAGVCPLPVVGGRRHGDGVLARPRVRRDDLAAWRVRRDDRGAVRVHLSRSEERQAGV